MTRLDRAERSYAERYCSAHGLDVSQFERHVLALSLHAPLRWFWPFFRPFLKNKLEIDRQCVANIGKFHSRKEIHEELVQFSYHPRNREFWRRVAGQRMSTTRLRRVLRNLPE